MIMVCCAKCLCELNKFEEAKPFIDDLLSMLPEHEEALELLEKINAKIEN